MPLANPLSRPRCVTQSILTSTRCREKTIAVQMEQAMTDENDAAGAQPLAKQMWEALGGAPELADRLAFVGAGALPSAFPVSDFAAASISAAGLAVAELAAAESGVAPRVVTDRRLASFWFAWSLRPIGWAPPPPWDPVAGDYRTLDGWIRLHTNAPRHRAAALDVLGVEADRSAVAQAVSLWKSDELEDRVVNAGGCAAAMRSIKAWRLHPQGRAVSAEPLVRIERRPAPPIPGWQPTPARPLAGLKVLDLTRVLAGPVATRFLAGFGAEVLRIDPPDWDEPGVVPEVTLGKRCARLDLGDQTGLAVFERLLSQADLLVHGYRPDALEQLGIGADRRRQLAPHLIEVTLDAYGWSGPWTGRRGFDSLVQMSAGIAEAGMRWKDSDRPTPLPVQALDHSTGYLMAAAAVRGVLSRLKGEGASTSSLSLARTAQALAEASPRPERPAFAPDMPADLMDGIELTSWGEARRLRPAVSLDNIEMSWVRPATGLGTDYATWAKRPVSQLSSRCSAFVYPNRQENGR
jgi:CoA-transferase family III